MGFFSYIHDAAVEANEDAHGTRLLEKTISTLNFVHRMDDSSKNRLVDEFLRELSKVKRDMCDWTKEGRIRVGRTMQSHAGEMFDTAQISSYAEWLAGAWLESKERRLSFKARQAYEMIDGLADLLKNELSATKSAVSNGGNTSQMSWAEWFRQFKLSAARNNAWLVLNEHGKSFIDFMDVSPLKRDFNKGIDPISLGRDFANQFDINYFRR